MMKVISVDKPIVMAIGLDKKRNYERVIVGEEDQVRGLLKGRENAEVFYDEKRELGTFLVAHQKHLDQDWNAGAIYPLKNAMKSPLGRKALETSAWEFLDEKHNLHDPLGFFVAYMCKYWYFNSYAIKGIMEKWDCFEKKSMCLTKSFKQEFWDGKRYYLTEGLLDKIRETIRYKGADEDTEAQIWYAQKKQELEYIVVTNSLYPAILYYLTRLQDLRCCFCQCIVCGRIFVATSGHHSLCSEECRKQKELQNKREFDERSRQYKYNSDCKNATQRMRNRLNRLKKKNASDEQIRNVEAVFRAFQKEAAGRKKKIKTEKDSKNFVDWLFEQERQLDDMCENVE